MASFHLVLAVFALMLGFGLLMVLSSSAATAFNRSDSAFAVFTNQALFAAIGLIAFVIVIRMPLRLIRSLSTTAVIVSLALLAAVLIPGIGTTYFGARSWISIGHSFQFQPSEVAKLALLLWSAHVMASIRSPYRRLKSLLIPVLPVFVLMVGLVMLQPDLGTTVTLTIVFLAVLYFAGAQLWIFGGLVAAGALALGFLATSAGYRMARVTAWLHPDVADPASTYQSFQGFYAMGSGGLFGVGLGQSKMKWGRLPNADSDFIFAIIGEELGLIGTLTVILLFAVLAYVGLRIARRNVDPFVKIAAAGGTVWLVGQAAVNIGYVTGLLPVTGIPLPMFSSGGTSLVITMVVFALLANFARREPQAAAALHGAGPRGLAAFLGIGVSRVDRPSSRRAARRAERVRARRAKARSQVSGAAGAGREPMPALGRRTPAGTASYPPPSRTTRRKTAHKTYRLRRAFGFPVPGDRRSVSSGRGRPSPGRTVRP
jgi:cell division protein FtsW